MPRKQVTIYCASSDKLAPSYYEAAESLADKLARNGCDLVYGGGNVGLMGRIAKAFHAAGAHVTGVIPTALRELEGIAYELADELIETETMSERKRIMFTRADAFVVLPGGFGTLEEFLEVLTLRQLGYHDKQIILLDVDEYWQGLLRFFEEMRQKGFAGESTRKLFTLASEAEEVASLLGLVRED